MGGPFDNPPPPLDVRGLTIFASRCDNFFIVHANGCNSLLNKVDKSYAFKYSRRYGDISMFSFIGFTTLPLW